MGSLIRTILIFAIVYYLIKKVGGFFYRTVAGDTGGNQEGARGFSNSQQTSRDGKIHINKNPQKDKKTPSNFKGGEYIDFEEVE